MFGTVFTKVLWNEPDNGRVFNNSCLEQFSLKCFIELDNGRVFN